MGCINSKKDDTNPNIFRVINVDDDGIALWSGQLGITRTELTLYRKGREPTHWPLACLRRYGYESDLFTFESGRRCTTGEGIYAFRCRRAEILFRILQNYIELPIQTDDSSIHDSYPVPIASNGPLILPRNRSSLHNSLSGNPIAGGTYVINARPTSQNLSPSGTIQSSSNRSRSSDTINGESNYLQPTPNRPPLITRFHTGMRLGSVSSGPLSPDPHSPGSPNSITNILEVTPLNPLPTVNTGISNVYSQTQINNNNNNNILANCSTNNNNNNNNSNNNNNETNNSKKLSLDIPPQEQAPSLQFSNTAPDSVRTDLELRMVPPPLSPNGIIAHSGSIDNSHMYMNISVTNNIDSAAAKPSTNSGNDTPQSIQTPTTSGAMFGLNRMNSSFSIDPNRCYENLEPLRNRFSKADIFTKIELPTTTTTMSSNSTDNKSSEPPTTPTNKRCNYIVLDLDQSNTTTFPSGIVANATSSSSAATAAATAVTATTSNASNSMFAMASDSMQISHFIGLLPPDSPKKGILDYATIDFNKTVALSNSTTPSSELDSEGSRQTRHSSTALLTKHSNSISD